MPRVKDAYVKKYKSEIEEVVAPKDPTPPPRKKHVGSGVTVEGVQDCLIKFSRCCNPLPGDDIIGFITRGFGVSIHKRSCTNVPADISSCEDPQRWVAAHWEDDIKETFQSTLEIIAKDRTGLLADVTNQLSAMHIYIHVLNSRELPGGEAVVEATVDINGMDHLRSVMARLASINGIVSVTRH